MTFWRDAQDREWRGRPAVPAFRFDGRTARQKRAAAWLAPGALAAVLVYVAIEPPLVASLGAIRGELVTLGTLAAPLGALWAVADGGVSARRALKTGGLFAFASVALYAWIFTGAWV